MSDSKITRLPKQTVELEISIPWTEIKSTYEDIIKSVSQTAELKGFRKGKAPKSLVEEQTDKKKVYEEVIKKIIPKAYTEAISFHKLIPVMSPRIEILKAKEGD